MDSMQGASMDPVSGRPVQEKEKQKRQQAHGKEVEQLRKQAQFNTVNESEAAGHLRELLFGRLYARIKNVLQDDEQAKAYVDMLSCLNEQADLAARATELLARYDGSRS